MLRIDVNIFFLQFHRCIPPVLNNEERQIFLGAVLDKTISASSEVPKLRLHYHIFIDYCHSNINIFILDCFAITSRNNAASCRRIGDCV